MNTGSQRALSCFRGGKNILSCFTRFVQLSLDERPSFLGEEKLPELRVNCFWIVHSVTCRETQRSARGRRLYCLTFIPHWLQAESGICTLTFLSFSLLAFHFSVCFPRISSMFLDSSQKVRTEPWPWLHVQSVWVVTGVFHISVGYFTFRHPLCWICFNIMQLLNLHSTFSQFWFLSQVLVHFVYGTMSYHTIW